jgi:glycerol kinase
VLEGVGLSGARYILAIDQGTTGTTALLLDGAGHVVRQASREIAQIYPGPGWVEHDPEEIWGSCVAMIGELLSSTGIDSGQVEAIGITNQRETAIVWDRQTGMPVANAIVWQCRRTAPLCEAMKRRGLTDTVRAKTGLPIDAYFSATKIRWILDSIPSAQRRAEGGELLFGTVDSWLMWKLTGGAVHATDVTNASRTMLYNIDTLSWDQELLGELEIPLAMLPEVRSSSELYGETAGELFGGRAVPISGVAGDQHSALFGQACFRPGMVKNTYGTGSFVLMNTGGRRVSSGAGLISTIAWGIGGDVAYALEGSIFATGATVQWLRDGLGLIGEASEINSLAGSVPGNGGVYMVPAFTGLGAPHWDMNARGTIVGITRGTGRGHIARAALESSAYQTRDVIEAMVADTGIPIPLLRVDGGGTASTVMMQFQADILDTPIERCAVAETTALGAGYLAGLTVSFWSGTDEIADHLRSDARFEPNMRQSERDALYGEWKRAVQRAKGWVKG